MQLALSTRWNAGRHTTGEAMIEEILGLGFQRVELGYDLTYDLVPGVQKMVQSGSVSVGSLHNFCPVPIGAFQGHPEIYLLADLNPHNRKQAIEKTRDTINFASEIGARVIVVHAGYVATRKHTRDLFKLWEKGESASSRYEKIKLKLIIQREKQVERYLTALTESLEALAPDLQKAGVTLALENLPSWEAVPAETEVRELCGQFEPGVIGYWHDIGHAEIRQKLGFIGHRRWLETLMPRLAGYHIHDVEGLQDHRMPPGGSTNFEALRPLIKPGVPLVMEPAPSQSPEAVRDGAVYLSEILGLNTRPDHAVQDPL